MKPGNGGRGEVNRRQDRTWDERDNVGSRNDHGGRAPRGRDYGFSGSNSFGNGYGNTGNGYTDGGNGRNNSGGKGYRNNGNGYNNGGNGYNNGENGYARGGGGRGRGPTGERYGDLSFLEDEHQQREQTQVPPRPPNSSGLVRKRKFVPPGRLENNASSASSNARNGGKFPGSAALGGGKGSSEGAGKSGRGGSAGAEGGGEDELPEELQHLEKAMVDKIIQEIQQRGDPVKRPAVRVFGLVFSVLRASKSSLPYGTNGTCWGRGDIQSVTFIHLLCSFNKR